MAIIGKTGARLVLATVLLTAGPVHALSPADKCEASKLGTAGKYELCRLKAEAKAVKIGGSPDFTKCDAAYSAKWMQAETKASGMCPSNGDEAALQAFITTHTDAVEAALDGNGLPAGTCAGFLLTTGQTTAYGGGSDGDLQKGAPHNYIDNGDGTITDNATGLMWEKKSQDGSIHDYGDTYTWSGPSWGSTYIMDGTITSTFLAALNSGGGFAGHTDWRIPNVTELQSILDYENVNPAVDAVFNTNCVAGCTVTTCSCTRLDTYWTSTTWRYFPGSAWGVRFLFGDGYGYFKNGGTRYVRAVRGGS